MNLTVDELRHQAKPRFGKSNPQLIKVPFWDNQIQTGEIAWSAARNVLGEDLFNVAGHSLSPVWTFHRFGSSHTRLPDGRVVCIAGEHEDHYDPDFNIYNDVVVFDPRGGWQVYIYPRDQFIPTDFHAAVYVAPYIYIIGSLGYPADRGVRIQLYRLDTKTWAMEKVDSSGAAPPWLHECLASIDSTGTEIRVIGGHHYVTGIKKPVKNDRELRLDVKSMTWRDVGPLLGLPVGPLGNHCADLSPVRSLHDVYRLIGQVRQTIGFDHELWGAELWPLYASSGEALFQIGSPDTRYVICDLAWSESRAQIGRLRCRLIEGGVIGLKAFVNDAASYDEFGNFDLK